MKPRLKHDPDQDSIKQYYSESSDQDIKSDDRIPLVGRTSSTFDDHGKYRV